MPEDRLFLEEVTEHQYPNSTSDEKIPADSPCVLHRLRGRSADSRRNRAGGIPIHRRQADPHDPGQGPAPQRHLLVLLDPLVPRRRDPARRRPSGPPLRDVDRAPHVHGQGREIRPHARRDQLRRGRCFARRDRRNQEPRHRTSGGLSGLQLRHRESRFPRTVSRAEGLPRRRDHSQRQILGQSAFDGMEARLRRYPRRVFRPDARNIHLRGQGVYAPVVRRIAADRHGRLHRHHLLHASSVLHAVHHRDSRQLDVGHGLQPAARRDDDRHRQRAGQRLPRIVGHRREREGFQPYQSHRHHPRSRPCEHGRHRSRALGQTDPEGEGRCAL